MDASSQSAPGFTARLWREAEAKASWVCLGLDMDLQRLPDGLPRSVAGRSRVPFCRR